VQGLVEAFTGVSLELDGVCGRGGQPPQSGDEEGSSGEAHFGSIPAPAVGSFELAGRGGWLTRGVGFG